MAYCMYLRKSRADIEAEARGEGETLARHEKALLDLATRMGIVIEPNAIYREIVSGETIAARPVMQRLLSEVEQGVWEGVLVMEVERLARGDTIDQGIVAQTFKYSGTKIITPVKTYDPANEFDEEYFEFGLFMSRREYKAINRRLQRGREMSVREGKYVGNMPPYGYRRERLQRDKGFTLVPDLDEAKIVKLVYEWFTGPERLGVCSIRNRLNSLRVPTRKGGPWSDETVRSILTNPVYAGKIRWGGRAQVKRVIAGEVVKMRPRSKRPLVVDGRHEALVSPETYEKAQAILAENSTPPVPSARELHNPLAGLIVCGVCDRKMVRRPYRYRGYQDSLICTGPTCSNVSTHLALVEDRLLSALEKWLERYRLAVQEASGPAPQVDLEAETRRQAIERLDSQIAVLKAQSDRLHDLVEQGVYTVDVFMARQKALSERLAAAQADKKALEDQSRRSSGDLESRRAFVPKVERIIELYHTLESPAEKNSLLKEVVEKAVYLKRPEDRGKPDAFDLVVYPKLPC